MQKLIGSLLAFSLVLPWPSLLLSSAQAATRPAPCKVRAPAGEIVWDLDLGGVISGAPAFNGNTSYIGQYEGGTEFFAIKDTGEVLTSSDIRYSVETAPAVSRDGKTIYANTVNQNDYADLPETLNDDETPTAQGRGTQALDATTLIVQAAHGGSDNQGSDNSPLVSKVKNRVYASTVDLDAMHESIPPKLYAMNSSSLDVEWEYPTPGWSFSSPVEDPKGNVYFGSEIHDSVSETSPFERMGRVISLDVNGNERWTLDVESEPAGGPALYVQKKKLFLIVRTMSGQILKINAANGNVEWELATHSSGFGAPVLGKKNATVYVTTGVALAGQESDYLNQLLALSEKDGSVLWTYTFNNATATPVVGTNGIYLVSAQGEVIALDHDGNELWVTELGHQVYYGFMGMNACGQLQIGTADGHMMAVGTESKGLERSSDWPTYRGDYGRTGYMF